MAPDVRKCHDGTEAPKLRKPATYEKGVQVDKGDSVKLTLSCSGEPTPEVLILKDGKPVEISEQITYGVQDSKLSLKILNAAVEDSGVYKITVENQAGVDEAVVRIIVTGKLQSGKLWRNSPLPVDRDGLGLS